MKQTKVPVNYDIDDVSLCLLHFAEALRERGELDLHLIAQAPELISGLVEIPLCDVCEGAAFVRIWPLSNGPAADPASEER